MSAGRDFADFESLAAAVETELTKILIADVASIAEEILESHIHSDIYGVDYRINGGWVGGETYQRREQLPSTVYSEMEDKSTLVVSANGSPNTPIIKGHSVYGDGGGFLKLLEKGPWGIYRHGFPRPAVTLAQREIDSSPRIAAAIERGIKKRIG